MINMKRIFNKSNKKKYNIHILIKFRIKIKNMKKAINKTQMIIEYHVIFVVENLWRIEYKNISKHVKKVKIKKDKYLILKKIE